MKKVMRGTAWLLTFCILLPGCLEETATEGESLYFGEGFAADQWAPIFTVESMDGELWSMEEQEDKVVVLAFIFTRCVDTCPITSASLKYAQTLLTLHFEFHLPYSPL